MKKNAIGHVLMHKEPVKKRLAALHLPAWILCLLLALVIWLSIVNLNPVDTDSGNETDTTVAGQLI